MALNSCVSRSLLPEPRHAPSRRRPRERLPQGNAGAALISAWVRPRKAICFLEARSPWDGAPHPNQPLADWGEGQERVRPRLILS